MLNIPLLAQCFCALKTFNCKLLPSMAAFTRAPSRVYTTSSSAFFSIKFVIVLVAISHFLHVEAPKTLAELVSFPEKHEEVRGVSACLAAMNHQNDPTM